jgi:hypothetical protein
VLTVASTVTRPDSSSFAERQPEAPAGLEPALESSPALTADAQLLEQTLPEVKLSKPEGPEVTRAAKAKRPKRHELSLCAIVCSLMMGASLVMVIWHLQEGSLDNAYTGSHYATIESLVDYGTYYIDQSRYVHTIDKYKVGDHFISSKQPTLSTYGAGVYWVYQKLTGKKIARYEGDVVRTVGFFTGGLSHLLFLIFFYRLCRMLLEREVAVMVAMAAASFAYLGVGYATLINKHSPAAALGVCGLYYALRIGAPRVGASAQAEPARMRDWWLAGLALGFMVAIDLPSLAFSGLVLVYLASHDWRRTLLWFVPALLPGLACQLILAYEISGSVTPFQMNQALKQFKGNYFKNPGGIDALREPTQVYAFNVLLGHHGLFSMTPLYAFGLWELGRSLWLRVRLRESLLVALTLSVLLGFYIFRTHNYGGWAVGMRWLVPAMPLLLLYFAFWVDRVSLSLGRWVLVLPAFLLSAFNVQDALTSPLQYSVWQNWLEAAPNRGRVGKTFNLPRRAKKSRPAPAPSAPGSD